MPPKLPLVFTLLLTATAAWAGPIVKPSAPQSILISVPDQKLVLFSGDKAIARYPVSTSKYGLGDRFGSYATPLGWMEVASKIGHNRPLGTVFKSRQPTGEILRPNAPGRDPIVTRILWLRGLEASSRNAHTRKIYIHGTPEERLIGRPASYGCVRMKSSDVADLFARVNVGAKVNVTTAPLRSSMRTFAAAAATMHRPAYHPGKRSERHFASNRPSQAEKTRHVL